MKRNFYLISSDVETDDERNREKLKKSRHARALKSLEFSDSETGIVPKIKQVKKFVVKQPVTVESASSAGMEAESFSGMIYFCQFAIFCIVKYHMKYFQNKKYTKLLKLIYLAQNFNKIFFNNYILKY